MSRTSALGALWGKDGNHVVGSDVEALVPSKLAGAHDTNLAQSEHRAWRQLTVVFGPQLVVDDPIDVA